MWFLDLLYECDGKVVSLLYILCIIYVLIEYTMHYICPYSIYYVLYMSL